MLKCVVLEIKKVFTSKYTDRVKKKTLLIVIVAMDLLIDGNCACFVFSYYFDVACKEYITLFASFCRYSVLFTSSYKSVK